MEIQNLCPMLIVKSKRGVGSFLTFDLVAKFDKSEIAHLWIYMCDWRLWQGEVCLLASNELDGERFEYVLNRLIGLSFINIREVRRGEIVFSLTEGYGLEIKANPEYEREDDLFIFYLDGSSPMAYSLKNSFYFENE
jgi:hypothetical protein